MGNQPTTVLPCNDNCERVKRNRQLAEAFNIDPSLSTTTTASTGPTFEYSEALIRHAHANPTWVKTTEEALAAFVADPAKRMFHFASGKTAGNPQLLELAKHYDLAASIIDADRKGLASVTVRKTAAKTASVPLVLLSVAAASWRPTTTNTSSTLSTAAAGNVSSSSSSSLAPKTASLSSSDSTTAREHINALHVANLQFGMDARDLHMLLEPVFCGGDVTISVRKLGEHDAVVIVSAEAARNLGGSTNNNNTTTIPTTTTTTATTIATTTTTTTTPRLAPTDIENLLVGIEHEVRAKFVGNNWCKNVSLCHASSATGEVVLGSRPRPAKAAGVMNARAAYSEAMRRKNDAVAVSNTFGSLAAATNAAAAGSASAPAPQSLPPPPPRAPTPEAWDEDSTLLSSPTLEEEADKAV
ncbi:hypothetical protein HDU86_001573 [Geranomyces michiganensis]|nr:hypothetical protein HDU86_001573 [Geranomyces michiganensis]